MEKTREQGEGTRCNPGVVHDKIRQGHGRSYREVTLVKTSQRLPRGYWHEVS
jgi:hypothetical protein